MSTNASPAAQDLDTLCVNTIRTLAADAVQKANSGHPGMPMGTAPMAYALWTRFLRFNPQDPAWPNRDRFVLSAGHGSMLLYALLHLTGYDLSLEDIKQFRQWDSATPGHPELGHTPGVETTTGPLGQGFGNAVGMALAEARLAAEFNRPGHDIIDHRTYVIASDGDIMEGVQSEAASFAGHLGLHKLTVLYDDNLITIDGSTDLTFSEDVEKRYEAYGWHVQFVEDGNDVDALTAAVAAANAEAERPSLIRVRTNIGYGSPNRQDTSKSHGEPLGEEEVRLTKENLGWPAEASFEVPVAAATHFRAAGERGDSLQSQWQKRLDAYRTDHEADADELQRRLDGRLADGWDADLPQFAAEDGPIATRAASGKALNALATRLPELMGGSADLAGSNKTDIDGEADFNKGAYDARNIRFGIREHAMGAILNGMVLHRGFIPYGGTFLIFSDYMRPSIRLAALMGQRVIYVYTHDSIGLGEDGPTHQPIEHLASLRAMPGLLVIRPADANETSEAWRVAVQRSDAPTALVLTRQKLPVLSSIVADVAAAGELARGAYVLADSPSSLPEIILLASGSEVHVALQAWQRLTADGVGARLVSMPSWELFEEQDGSYRDAVLPPSVEKRLAIEAGSSFGWSRYVGLSGDVIGIDRFGASSPGSTNMEEFGFTPGNVERRARALLMS
ncbi:MAG: transketolase [Acidobacteria bacterium]|nr:MAG: transketolase [Acidobacteriota bacterium]